MVELLVVLGIVGIAAAVLLPAVQTVRRTAATASCADNLRTLGLAITGYVSDHQFYPYGRYGGNGSVTQPDRGEDATSVQTVVWWSVLRGYVSGSGSPQHNGAESADTVPFTRINELFNCPAAVDRTNGVDYVANAAVMVQYDLEFGLSGHPINKMRNSLARATGVYSDTALLWDAPEIPNISRPLVRKTQFVVSYGIDAGPGTEKATADGLLATPKKPSWRYRNVNNINRTNDPKEFANGTPIYTGINEDVTAAGGIRFRHGANNEANFLFADGSVRAHRMTLNWNTTPTGTLLRKYFRSKLPPGFSSVDAPGN